MQCTKCGKELNVKDKFCKYCGTKVEKYDYTPYVLKAEQGDEEAFKQLCLMTEGTYRYYIQINSKNKNVVDDLLQESYLQIYQQMVVKKQLKSPDAFFSWGKMIVAGTVCKYYSRTKHETYEILPSPITNDDGTEEIVEFHKDEYAKDYNPEAVVTEKETIEIIHQIIDDLPQDQKQCILLWMDERTTGEIAEILGMPSGTVKSNIFYAKKKIKTKVEDLEKQGTKLYGMAPFTFFVWLIFLYYRYAEFSLPSETAPILFDGILNKIHELLGNNGLQDMSETVKGTIGNGTNPHTATVSSKRVIPQNTGVNPTTNTGITEPLNQNMQPNTGNSGINGNLQSQDIQSQVHGNDAAHTGQNSSMHSDASYSNGSTATSQSAPNSSMTSNFSSNSTANVTSNFEGPGAKIISSITTTVTGKIITCIVIVTVIIGAGVGAWKTNHPTIETPIPQEEVVEPTENNIPDESSEEEKPEAEAIDYDKLNRNDLGITLEDLDNAEDAPLGIDLTDAGLVRVAKDTKNDIYIYQTSRLETSETSGNENYIHYSIVRVGNIFSVHDWSYYQTVQYAGDIIYEYGNLYYEDFDNDGEKEIAYITDTNSGAYTLSNNKYTGIYIRDYSWGYPGDNSMFEPDSDDGYAKTGPYLTIIDGNFSQEQKAKWNFYQLSLLKITCYVFDEYNKVDINTDTNTITLSMLGQTFEAPYTVSVGLSAAGYKNPQYPQYTWSYNLTQKYGGWQYTIDGNQISLKVAYIVQDNITFDAMEKYACYYGSMTCDVTYNPNISKEYTFSNPQFSDLEK